MLLSLKLEQVVASEGQPRKTFYQDTLEELAQSIRERGVLEPIVVRPVEDGRYEIIMGERRYRASQIAGLAEIPAIVRDIGEEDARVDALLENFQREDLNPVERAQAIQELLETTPMEKVTKVLGVTEATIRRHLEILDLPQAVLEEMQGKPGQNPLTEGHGRVLRGLAEDPVAQVRLARKIKEERLSIEDTQRLVDAVQNFPDKKEAILRVPLKVAEEIIRHAARERGLKRKRPFKPQTAQSHAGNLSKTITLLQDLVDPRVTEFLARDECETLLASCTGLAEELKKLTEKLRSALSEQNDFKEVYINCAVCGRIELIAKTRCSTCWSVLKRCADCALYDKVYQRCSEDDTHIPNSDAEAPSESSRSYKCEWYKPKFEVRRAA